MNLLYVMDMYVIWGRSIVVPQAGHRSVMEQLHDGHPDISRIKSLAITFVWSNQMVNDIADRVKSCLCRTELFRYCCSI